MRDNLTPAQRSYAMSQVKSKDTSPERVVRSALHKRGLRFRKHVKGLPGKPDLVFPKEKVVVFIDGDFWHGWRFPVWSGTLTPAWQEKIGETRARDQRNIARLRRDGWRVLRVWEHSIGRDLDGVIDRIVRFRLTGRR